MYHVNKQGGRTNVNILSDSKKTRKTHVQHKKTTMTGLDKLYELQTEFFKDGMSSTTYKDHIQTGINKEGYYYKNISSDDFDKLTKRYSRMEQTKKNNLTLTLTKREMKNRQKNLFKDKKRVVIEKQKREMIIILFKELSRTTALGVSNDIRNHSTSPDDWNETKKLLFHGGRYFEKQDQGWVKVYRKIVSGSNAHLFGINSHDDFHRYVTGYNEPSIIG